MNVGLVTAPATPSARAAPRTNAVLPAPSSPSTYTTAPCGRSRASAAASAAVSCSEEAELLLIGGDRRDGLGCRLLGRPRDGGTTEQLAEAPDIGFECGQEARVVQGRGRVVER